VQQHILGVLDDVTTI